MKKYRVQIHQDNTYEVVTRQGDDYDWWYESLFQGSLSDCEAYIRLKENELVDF